MKKYLKKFIALTALAVLSQAAISAEIKITQNARIRTSLYSQSKPADGDASTKLWNLKNSSAADYLNFKVNNDYSGVVIESVWDAGKKNQTGVISFDTYYGWISFGKLKFSFGDYDSRFTNRYNVTATEAGLLDSDIAKYGLSNKLAAGLKETKGASTTEVKYSDPNDSSYTRAGEGINIWTKTSTGSSSYSVAASGKTWLYDFGNAAQSNGGENLSLIADYTIDEVAGGKLLLKGGLLENAYDETNKFSQLSGYIAEAAWQGENASVDVIFKNPVHKAYGAGAYITVNPGDTITAVLGFTGGKQEDVIDLVFAVDGRFQLLAGDEIKVTVVGKYSSLKAKGADDAETGLEVGAEVSYKASDLLTLALDARLDYVDLDNNDKKDLGENTVTVSPRAKISAGPAAAVTAALEFTQALNAGDDFKAAEKTKILLPVIFRVKL